MTGPGGAITNVQRKLREWTRHIARTGFLDLNPDAGAAILLAGSGRSGTTWVSDIINYDNRLRYLFEPFFGREVPAFRHFATRQYLRPECDDPRYLDPVRRVLTGRIRNRWVDNLNRRVVSRRRLVKDIRGCLLLAWIHRHFPEVPIVYLLRHPCAVAVSMGKMGWHPNLERLYLSQPELVEDYLAPYLDVIRSSSTPFEDRIVHWCVENFVALRQLDPAASHLCFYESFCTDPETECRRLFAYLGEPLDERAMAAITRPSALSRKDSAIRTGSDLLNSWKREVSEEERQTALHFLRAFGLDGIYSEESLPSPQAARALLGAGPVAGARVGSREP